MGKNKDSIKLKCYKILILCLGFSPIFLTVYDLMSYNFTPINILAVMDLRSLIFSVLIPISISYFFEKRSITLVTVKFSVLITLLQYCVATIMIMQTGGWEVRGFHSSLMLVSTIYTLLIIMYYIIDQEIQKKTINKEKTPA